MSTTQLIRRNELEKLIGLSRSCIYKRMSEGTFPKPIPLGGRLVAWKAEDIESWIQDRITEAREAA